MAKLTSISQVNGSTKAISINDKKYLKSFEAQINGSILTINETSGLLRSYQGILGEFTINGNTSPSDPDEAIKALEFIGNFKSGGSTPSPTDTPTLQEVLTAGNTSGKDMALIGDSVLYVGPSGVSKDTYSPDIEMIERVSLGTAEIEGLQVSDYNINTDESRASQMVINKIINYSNKGHVFMTSGIDADPDTGQEEFKTGFYQNDRPLLSADPNQVISDEDALVMKNHLKISAPSGFVKIQSDTTQVIDSDLSLDREKTLFGISSDNSQHTLLKIGSSTEMIPTKLTNIPVGTNLRGKTITFERRDISPEYVGEPQSLIFGESANLTRSAGSMEFMVMDPFSIVTIFFYEEWLESKITIPDDKDYIVTTNTLKSAVGDDWGFDYAFVNLPSQSQLEQIKVGSESLHLNLNSTNRPTVEISNKKEAIAYLSDTEGSIVFRNKDGDIPAIPSPDALYNYIVDNYGRNPIMGDLIRDTDKTKWWFDGTSWEVFSYGEEHPNTPFKWMNKVNVVDAGGVILKNVATAWGNSGACSDIKLNGNYSLSFKMLSYGAVGCMGLSKSDTDQSYMSIEYGFMPVDGGVAKCSIFESGANKKGGINITQDSIYEIRIINNKAEYYVDGVLQYTSSKAVSGPMLVDFAGYGTNAAYYDFKFEIL